MRRVRILRTDLWLKVRLTLQALLEHKPGVALGHEIVGTEDLLIQVAVASPDLALLDWKPQGLPAIDLLPTLKRVCPKVIFLSGLPEARRAALDTGAGAFVSKTDPSRRWQAAINLLLDR